MSYDTLIGYTKPVASGVVGAVDAARDSVVAIGKLDIVGAGLGDGVVHVRSSGPGVLAVEVPGLVEFTQYAPDVPARHVDGVGDRHSRRR